MRSDVAPADSPDCRHPPGAFRPVVDPRRCEGKAACVAVCPWDVFVVRKFASGERPGLGPLGTVRLWMHGGMQADTVNAQQCHGCGLCVTACPEDAITLQRSGA